MKIVQVIPDFDLGGIQKAGIVLAGELVALGHEAVVMGLAGGPRFIETPPEGLLHQVVANAVPSDYASEILSHEPDVVHIHDAGYDEPLVESLSESRTPSGRRPLLVSTPVFGRPPASRGVLQKTRTAVVGTYIHYRLRHWLGMSVLEAFENGVAHTPVVSFQSTDPPQSTLDPPEVGAARRAEFGLPADAFVAGRIGRASPEKWHPANREMIDRFLEAHSNGAWLSVGYPHEEDVAALRQRWGSRFVSLPQSADYELLTRAFASMDVQVFMSCAGECFAATICEPAGVGLPTIALTNPVQDNGQAEQVVDGVTGYLVASVDGALERLSELVSQPDRLRSLKQSTQQHAHQRWTPEIIAGELLELYEAWLDPQPMQTERMKRLLGEARDFGEGYLPRLIPLLGKTAKARLWWRLKLAAARNWRAFRLAGRVKQWIT